MDCCICSPMVSVYRPPRNTICASCYQGARSMIAFLNELDGDGNGDGVVICSSADAYHGSKPMATKGILHAFKRMKEMEEKEKEMKEKMSFLDGLAALREGIHTDILVKPGSGPPIPAHRALLAAKSEIFKTMLLSDDCKAAPTEDTISLVELSHDELKYLLEFLYSGSLPAAAAEKQACAYSLLIASDKYDIPFLRKQCEKRILAALQPSNALDVLEVSEVCSNAQLKEEAMDVIVKHAEDVVFSARYEEFARKNSHLCVEITRAFLSKMTAEKAERRAMSPCETS
ncbi:BTB/POZ domain-containing protein [Canna indica]|uniref:BTB/POZ domain-containing protein n=1 Tax=Canna indica TaxID=4628 RepID=A0AAQ3KWY7_9LILI|nr:BTB/POZ domain-containing protein [Canna indica]